MRSNPRLSIHCLDALTTGFHGEFVIFVRQATISKQFNNRVFMSRNYRLIDFPRKFDVLKTNSYPKREASRANMLVLRTSNFSGATIRPIVSRHKHSIVFIVHISMKVVKAKYKI